MGLSDWVGWDMKVFRYSAAIFAEQRGGEVTGPRRIFLPVTVGNDSAGLKRY